MKTRGGGWTVLQRRGEFGQDDNYFLKGWDKYKNGFGNQEEVRILRFILKYLAKMSLSPIMILSKNCHASI